MSQGIGRRRHETSPSAYQVVRRNSASSIARRMAAGMGGGAEESRSAPGRLAEGGFDKPARAHETKCWRVLGCAMASTAEIGGGYVSGLALRPPNVAQAAGVHCGCGALTGVGNWRQYGHLQPPGRSAVEVAPGARARPASAARLG